MDSVTRSRKRKQRPSESDPFSGIFTRSRSQIYSHRHRSGYTRSDSKQSRNFFKQLLVKQKQQQRGSEAVVDEIASQGSVKDLRARRVFSPAAGGDDVGNIGEVDLDLNKKSDGNPNPNPNVVFSEGEAGESDLGVSEAAGVEVNGTEADDVVGVLVMPISEGSEGNKKSGEKNEMVSVAKEVADVKGIVVKNQSSVTSLRGQRKVFKSPSSFSYRRLLPYLKDLGNEDSTSFEIVEATLPKVVKSSDTALNMIACKDEEIGSVKLADGLLNNAKSCAKPVSDRVNAGLTSTVESSDAAQKSKENIVDDTLEREQMTPPDSDIRHKSKIDDNTGVLVNPKPKPAIKLCSRKKVLQNPTSFSHRRLLPFLTSVAEDYSCPLKGNQSLNLVKATEQNQQPLTKSLLHRAEKLTTANETSNSLKSTEPNQQPPTQSLLHQVEKSIITNETANSSKSTEQNQLPPTQSLLHQAEKSISANGTSNSPTSTLVPVDTVTDITKSVTSVPNDNIMDANGPDQDGSGSISQVEVNQQLEAEKSDSCIKLEQSPPKANMKSVEEATFKATPPCIEQSCNEDRQIVVKESPSQQMLHITETHGEIIKSGILKRTPRGCRGICNCLNCTSFRLHAERSFEFSKNQFHDAEEVALELINDLTCLRKILETTDYSHSLDTDKEKEVKEACAKALYKEQVARARLAQMNEDLSIHCRSANLLRPKVTFANKIEEKLIAKK